MKDTDVLEKNGNRESEDGIGRKRAKQKEEGRGGGVDWNK